MKNITIRFNNYFFQKGKGSILFYLLFGILLLAAKLSAQNWQPVATNNKYIYQLNNTVKSFTAIWADSAIANKIYLNKILKTCDTCSYIHLLNFPDDSLYLWQNSCDFLQHKIIDLGNRNFQFKGERNFLLKLNTPVNTWWLYDTANAIQAKIISNAVQPVFSISDSVKTIILSSLDTIVVSKNYGVLKFPKINSLGTHYNLVGIEGINVGYTLPKFSSYFNFSVGDIFQYTLVDDNYTSFPPQFNRGLEKITILGKQTIGDTLRYHVKRVEIDSAWIGSNPAGYAFTNTITTIDFIDSASHFTNLYPQQMVKFNNYFPLTFLDTLVSKIECEPTANNTLIKRMGLACPYYLPNTSYPYALAVYTHSITDLYLAVNSHLIFGREAKEHLGITSEIFYNYDYLTTTCLSAYRTGTDSSGIILSDTQILSINETTLNDQLLIYPNPAKDQFTILNNSNLPNNLYLYNSLGQLALQTKEEFKTTLVNTQQLENGIYFLVLENKNNKKFKKIVISK